MLVDPFLTDYASFVYGMAGMVFFHNACVSLLLYKARRTNVSNILKIIFNLAGCARFILEYMFFMLPNNPTLAQCKSVVYLQVINNFIYKESLAIFLLWRLKQIENKKWDWNISLVLLFLRTAFQFGTMAMTRSDFSYDPIGKDEFCVAASFRAQIPTWCYIGIDFIIDVFVTIRLVQILTKANRNATQIASKKSHQTKRSLFTAVMYWNFLRLFVAFILNVVSSLDLRGQWDQIPEMTYTLQSFLGIALSYVVTVDAEIVRVIEGKNEINAKGASSGSVGTEKSLRSTPHSPGMPRVPPHYQSGPSTSSSKGLPEYTPPSPSFQLSSVEQKQQYDRLDADKVVVVSMKRLSFFEWANTVVGLRRGKRNELDEEDQEEILDRPSEAADVDPEKGPSQASEKRRSSTFSGTTTFTETTTFSADGHDVV